MALRDRELGAKAVDERVETLLAAEDRLRDASARAIRAFLDRIRERIDPDSLVAAAGDRARLWDLGEAHEWWDEAIDENVKDAVRNAWEDGYRSTRDGELLASSIESADEYLANVTDRLSRTATPTIPEQAMDRARVALAEETARGSDIDTVSQRLAADFGWDDDAEFWRGRLDELDAEVDRRLDAIGEPGDSAREYARLNDDDIRELQNERARARRRIDRVQSEWETRAERIARTETTGALNAGGLAAAADEGAKVKVWIATGDDRTRDSHLDAHGECTGLDGSFIIDGSALVMPGDPDGPAHETINCRAVLPGTRVAGDVLVAMKRPWSGPTRVIETAGGYRLAATAEHPVLTRRGWLAAGDVEVGDECVRDPLGIERTGTRRDGSVHVDDAETAVEEVYEALALASLRGQGRRADARDLDDDGRDVKVDVAAVDDPLAFGVDAAGRQRLRDLGVALSHREVCATSDPATLARVTETNAGRLGSASRLVAAAAEPSDDRRSRQSGRSGEAEDRLAALMPLGEVVDEVVAVRDGWFDGHVYDLTTPGGVYTADGILVHNCTIVYARDCDEAESLFGDASEPIDEERERRGRPEPGESADDGVLYDDDLDEPTRLARDTIAETNFDHPGLADDELDALIESLPEDVDIDVPQGLTLHDTNTGPCVIRRDSRTGRLIEAPRDGIDWINETPKRVLDGASRELGRALPAGEASPLRVVGVMGQRSSSQGANIRGLASRRSISLYSGTNPQSIDDLIRTPTLHHEVGHSLAHSVAAQSGARYAELRPRRQAARRAWVSEDMPKPIRDQMSDDLIERFAMDYEEGRWTILDVDSATELVDNLGSINPRLKEAKGTAGRDRLLRNAREWLKRRDRRGVRELDEEAERILRVSNAREQQGLELYADAVEQGRITPYNADAPRVLQDAARRDAERITRLRTARSRDLTDAELEARADLDFLREDDGMIHSIVTDGYGEWDGPKFDPEQPDRVPAVTDYAASAPRGIEDWAETWRLYVHSKRHNGVGDRAAKRVRFEDIFPERAAGIEEVADELGWDLTDVGR